LGEPAGVEEKEFQLWKDGVGEEIDVKDKQEEELEGGQTETMRSQVREESSGDGLGRVLDFEEGFVAGKEDLNSVTRLEQGESRAGRKKSLDIWNFGSLAIEMAEIVKMYNWEKIKSTIFRPLRLIV
jgi:hypothetical protein